MNNEWKLKSIEIEFKEYGEYKGKYIGSIRFSNGENESFRFNLRDGMAKPYIDLMADDIVKSASDLGERLIKSLGSEKDNE